MTLRLWLIIGAAASTLALLAYVGHLRSEVTKQRERAVLAEANAAQRSNETKVIENYHTQTKIIRETVEKEAHAVEQIPSDDIPAELLERWRDGLSNVQTNSVDQHPDEPSRTLH
jgi:hypothetical protein